MEESNPLYTKGFNDGYLLNKYEPELLAKVLTDQNPEHLYFQALKDGKKEHEKEKALLEIKKMKDQSKDKGQEREI